MCYCYNELIICWLVLVDGGNVYYSFWWIGDDLGEGGGVVLFLLVKGF